MCTPCSVQVIYKLELYQIIVSLQALDRNDPELIDWLMESPHVACCPVTDLENKVVFLDQS